MRVYCKKSYRDFKKDEWYSYEIHNSNIVKYVKINNCVFHLENRFNNDRSIFRNHFYTEKQVRQLKLKQI